jgi:hypothetical protein
MHIKNGCMNLQCKIRNLNMKVRTAKINSASSVPCIFHFLSFVERSWNLRVHDFPIICKHKFQLNMHVHDLFFKKGPKLTNLFSFTFSNLGPMIMNYWDRYFAQYPYKEELRCLHHFRAPGSANLWTETALFMQFQVLQTNNPDKCYHSVQR